MQVKSYESTLTPCVFLSDPAVEPSLLSLKLEASKLSSTYVFHSWSPRYVLSEVGGVSAGSVISEASTTLNGESGPMSSSCCETESTRL